MNGSAANPAPGWAERLRSGDRSSIARALTAVENETTLGQTVLRDIYPLTGGALVAGFTGPPGVGKSTLLNACIHEFRRQGLTVGVVAVDPSSLYSGGAILGDRVRMQEHSGDDGVFIRSIASRGHLGGLSRSTARVIDVLDAAGKDIILVETVGTGQSETEITEIAPVRVVVVQPGAGDGIQALKAGVLEIANILVVNKSDLPGAERCVSDLRQMISLRGKEKQDVAIFQTRALEGDGVKELVQAIRERHANGNACNPAIDRVRRLLVTETCNHLRRSLLESAKATRQRTELDALSEQVLKAELTLDEAVQKLSGGLHRAGTVQG